jgi:glutathione S-transferase
MPTLHGVNASPFVRKARIALKEKGIAYELNPVFPVNVSDDYKKLSPLGKIPCYTPKEGVNIPDSSVIIAYLERTTPNPPLYPSKPEEFARALFLEEYGDSALVGAVGTVFFQRIVGPRFMNQPTDEAAVSKALTETLPPLLAYLESHTAGKQFLVGNAFSVADIGITSPFINLMHAGVTVDAGRYPNLAKYLAAMMERPSIKELIEEEKALFSQAA